MHTTETLQHFGEITEHYIQELNEFTMEQLRRQPSESEWSLGQMYVHLINSALYMQLRNADDCMTRSEDAIISTEGKTETGEAIFNQGSLPPIRIQVPASPQYTPGQPDSKEQLVQGLQAVLRRMKEIGPMLEQESMQHTVAHPRFGMLNAKEWFMLVEMHYRHHLRQKDRLKNELASSV
ncbi:DinB family protein [Paenibacillus sp. WQ 127069]|uniref:DinB family protein n=1 Tax=Paenibacillus baimaensis TaxID=2982185 RepID=A0ABT2UDE7_9BACL|nr:DinB family protein [Paenibacillus sp. WQ 127069]MCU6792011.1 DinB family protein [Paenibacillus sp. WQ 127069]